MILLRPYPFSVHTAHKLSYAIGAGVFTVLFLGIVQPYSMTTVSSLSDWLSVSVYGLIVGATVFLSELLLPFAFPNVFRDERWNFLKQILFSVVTLLFITLALGFFQKLLGNSFSVLSLAKYVLTIGSFLIVTFTFIDERLLLRNRLEQAEKLVVSKKANSSESVPKVSLRGQSDKETIELMPEQFIYAVADGNYVSIYWWQGDEMQRTLLRQTFKNVAQQLAGQFNLVQTHRGYIVNRDHVEDVSGNKNGLQLSIKRISHRVPVSRPYVASFQG
jgi:LytTr DNA-binding domain